MPQLYFVGRAMLAAQSGGMPAGSILHFDKALLIQLAIQWLNIALLTALLIFILYRPVKKFMADRAARIRSEIESAQAQRQEAQELREKYELLIADIEKERDEILHLAHKKAVEKSDQMLMDARREAEALADRALAEVALERKNMENDLKKQVVELAFLMAGRFVEVSVDRETQDRLIEEAFSGWEEL